MTPTHSQQPSHPTPQLPPVLPEVTAAVMAALSARLRKRLDAAVEKLATRSVTSDGGICRIVEAP
ncbi:hypothetical protein [Streptomyces sp. NPDC058247]|uniref:hypothetical protein n=1 Tax=Streptomyces sp. NPDC058247 TaxID=3346401 RepID=UPI0036E094AF